MIEKSTAELTAERGAKYGPALQHFAAAETMAEDWTDHRAWAREDGRGMQLLNEQEDALVHGVRWICDKLIRAAYDPTHADNWDDIAGYALKLKQITSGQQS